MRFRYLMIIFTNHLTLNVPITLQVRYSGISNLRNALLSIILECGNFAKPVDDLTLLEYIWRGRFWWRNRMESYTASVNDWNLEKIGQFLRFRIFTVSCKILPTFSIIKLKPVTPLHIYFRNIPHKTVNCSPIFKKISYLSCKLTSNPHGILKFWD